jgi:hypothetical protein
MELFFALVFAALMIIGALSAFFLAVVQPVWGIVDVAISENTLGLPKPS